MARHNITDGMFDTGGLDRFSMPVRQASSTSNIDSEMLAELFPDSPSATKISSRGKGRSLSRGNSFVVSSSGKEKAPLQRWASARKLCRLRQRITFLHPRI